MTKVNTFVTDHAPASIRDICGDNELRLVETGRFEDEASTNPDAADQTLKNFA